MEVSLDKDTLAYYSQDIFAKTAAGVLYDTAIQTEEKEATKSIFETWKTLIENQQHNIVLRNAADYFIYRLPKASIKEKAREKYAEIIKKINRLNDELSSVGAKKIGSGHTVFIHSLNNHIYGILEKAAKYKKYNVNMVEHTNLSSHFSKKLREKGLEVKVYPAIAIKQAISEAEICLIGGEAITKDTGAVAKIGSAVAAHMGKEHHIPVYVCAHSWKYDYNSQAEKLLAQTQDKKGHHFKKLYEHLSPNLITRYICEHGILKPEHILEEIKYHEKWRFI